MNAGGLDASRLAAAAGVVAAYAALCVRIALGERRKRRAAAREARGFEHAGGGDVAPVLVVHASQTGNAERIARETARALHEAGVPVRLEALGALLPDDLARATTALFVASTCGEGDAPDSAAAFVRRFMADDASTSGAARPLAGLHVGVLALGDREFAQFAAFGRRLEAWLLGRGAQALFARIDVDGEGGEALARWQHELGRFASVADTLAWQADAPRRWRLAARRQLNPGSVGRPVFHLELEPPADGEAGAWEAGDLARIAMPEAAARPRDYSIASIAGDGRVHLLIRQHRDDEGRLGLASGWLTESLGIGGEVPLTLVPHRHFRLGDNAARPLILVGNGTGIAGLRSHLRARAAAGGGRQWLVFGERQAAHDFHFREDVLAWQASGVLERVDLAFSRDPPARRYVQDCLREQAPAVRAWIADGAAIYLCGSLDGMASGVHDALVDIVGAEAVEALVDSGRYRRDVY